MGSSVAEFRPGEVVAIASHGSQPRAGRGGALAAKKPANLTFEQAATIPAFLTADYCFDARDSSRRVRVDSRRGRWCRRRGSDARTRGSVATASPRSTISASRVCGMCFTAQTPHLWMAFSASASRGCQLARGRVHCPARLNCFAPGGRFVEIGKKDIFQNSVLD